MRIQKDTKRICYKIAKAYYQEQLTQQEIATRFRFSRPKVSRILQQAKELGIVKINLIPPSSGFEEEEASLEHKYRLDEAVIVSVSESKNSRTVAMELGSAAAEIFIRSIQGNEIVGMAWGASISSMVDALPWERYEKLTLVQLTGGLGADDSNEHSAELTRKTAQKLNAQFRLLSAPGIALNQNAYKAFSSDPQIRETLSLAEKADIAFVGLGILSDESILLQRSELLSAKDQKTLKKAGAVGDVVLRFLNQEGEQLDLDINDRIVGIGLESLKKIPRVVGIAGGEPKRSIIQAALNANILNVLITDHKTANYLLQC